MTELDLLWASLGSASGYHALRFTDRAGERQTIFVPVENRARFLRLGRDLRVSQEPELGAVPFETTDYRRPGLGAVLWVRVESGAAFEKLNRFLPRPTVALREGRSVRAVALWALSKPLTLGWLEQANRRIAHALGAPKKYATPWFSFPLPGSTLHRSKPLLIVTETCEQLYAARDVVGDLPVAPDPNAWKARQAA